MKTILFSFVALMSIFCTELVAELSQPQVEEVIREKINLLGPGNSFTFVDLQITEEQFHLIDQLNFDKIPSGAKNSYNRFGNL